MNFSKLHKVLKFIEAIKGSYPFEIEDTFSNGFCYWFAKILELRFKGTIYFNPEIVHFATLIDDQLFDVYGLIHVDNLLHPYESWYNWEDYSCSNDVHDIIQNCILKVK